MRRTKGEEEEEQEERVEKSKIKNEAGGSEEECD
jgi:hypothetical protein